MAVKSVIDIQLNDASFEKFRANFKDYQERLAKTPGMWTATTASANDMDQSFQSMTAALMAHQTHLAGIANSQKTNTLSANSQVTAWKSMAGHAKTFATHILDATRSLLRWGTLTGLISGLLGAGGIFGIERLAMSASDQRKSASGLNISAGDRSSFTNNYRRLLDSPEGLLSGVNQAQTDPAKRASMMSLGMSEQELQGNAAEVAQRLIAHMKQLADATDPKVLGGVFDARHLGELGFTKEDFIRMRGRPGGEIAGYGRDFERDRRSGPSDPTLKAWEDFKTQLGRAGQQIENTFINGLVPLAGPLTDLSKSFVELVKALLEAPEVKGWILDLASGLRHFAATIGTDSFRQKVTDLAANVGSFIGHVITVVEGLGRLAGKFANLFPGADKEQFGPPEAGKPAVVPGLTQAERDHRDDVNAGRTPRGMHDPVISGPFDERENDKKVHESWAEFWKGLTRGFDKAPVTGDGTGGFSPIAYHPGGDRDGALIKAAFSPGGAVPMAAPTVQLFFKEFWIALIEYGRRQLPGGGNGGSGASPFGQTPGITNASFTPGEIPAGASGDTSGNAKIANDFFRAHGWGAAATAGLLANFKGESEFDPQRVNKTGGDAGLMQWRGPRAALFKKMFGHRVQDGTLMEQLQFAQFELTQGSERAHGDILRQMTDPRKAGAYVTTDIERPDPNRVAAIARERGGSAVRIYIENNTGGNATVRAAALPGTSA